LRTKIALQSHADNDGHSNSSGISLLTLYVVNKSCNPLATNFAVGRGFLVNLFQTNKHWNCKKFFSRFGILSVLSVRIHVNTVRHKNTSKIYRS